MLTIAQNYNKAAPATAPGPWRLGVYLWDIKRLCDRSWYRNPIIKLGGHRKQFKNKQYIQVEYEVLRVCVL